MQDGEWLLPFSFNISAAMHVYQLDNISLYFPIEGFYRDKSKGKHKLPYASRIVIRAVARTLIGGGRLFMF